MKVTVTQRDINRGREGSRSSNCPLARAIRRALGDHAPVGVGFVAWERGDGRFVSLPKKARQFRSDFDNFGPQAVEPFSFVTVRRS
jgi:hypothetical protein